MPNFDKALNPDPFVDAKDLKREYDDARTYTEAYFARFPAIERAAFSLPLPYFANLQKQGKLPDINDGTLKSIIDQKPSRLIKQVPSAKVIHRDPFYRIIFSYILNKLIIPNMNRPHSSFEKSIELVRRALIYGNQPIVVIYRSDEYFDGYNGPDTILPEIRDVLYSQGAASIADANVIFYVQYWAQSALDKLILQIKKMPDGKQLQSGWRLKDLQYARDNPSSGKGGSVSFSGRGGHSATDGTSNLVPLINIWQRGIKSNFYVYDHNNDKIVRKWANPSPSGEIPATQMFFGTDPFNPMGRGIAEAAAPLQNYVDLFTTISGRQALYNTEPASWSRGSTPLNTIQLGLGQHNHIQDPDFEFNLVPMETQTLLNALETIGAKRAQILEVTQSSSAAVSAGSSQPSFSKTPQGVDFQAQRQQAEDNHLLEKYEICMKKVYDISLEWYLAIQQGKQEIEVDEETKEKLLALPKFPEKAARRLESDNVIILDYDKIKGEVAQVAVDPRSSSLLDRANQQFRLERLLELAGTLPEVASSIITANVVRRLIYTLEIDDPESLLRAQDEDPGPPLSETEIQQVTQIVEEIVANKTIEDPVISALKSLGISVELTKGEANQLKEQLLGVTPDSGVTTTDRKLNIEAVKALSDENVPEGQEDLLFPEDISSAPRTDFAAQLIDNAKRGVPPRENFRQALGNGQTVEALPPEAQQPQPGP